MSLRLQVIVAVVIVLSLAAITNMIRKKKLDLKHGLIWYVLGIIVLVCDIFPNLLVGFTEFMGIASPVNMLFFLGFCFSLVIIFMLTVWTSRTAERVSRLTQEIALLEKQIKELEEKK